MTESWPEIRIEACAGEAVDVDLHAARIPLAARTRGQAPMAGARRRREEWRARARREEGTAGAPTQAGRRGRRRSSIGSHGH
jgi:hypothetical protein